MLGLSLHGWENAMVVFLIVAGFFALVAGAATWAVVKLQRVEIAEANRSLAEYKMNAERQIAQANAAGEAAKAEAAKAQLETERLKKEFGWRDVTPSGARQLAAMLRGKSIQVSFFWGAGDAEGSYFAQRLAQALAAAGVQVMGGGPMGQLGAEMHGIEISGWKPDDVKSVADALAEIGLGPVDRKIVPPPATPQSAGQYTVIFVGYRAAPKLDVAP
jgi:hypothetical protein